MPLRFRPLAIIVSIGIPFATSSALGAADVRYVDDDAGAGGDGLAWESAYRNVQDALAAARSDALITEIRVGEGTYTPDQGNGAEVGDREMAFELVSGVALLGGFAGLAGEDSDLRDPALFTTVLSGDLLDNDDPGFKNFGENSRQVVRAIDVGPGTLLEGFTITGGNADGVDQGADPASRNQGAALNIWGGELVLRDVVVDFNRVDSHGIVNDHGAATVVEGCTISRSDAAAFAAGIYCAPESATTITGCHFEGNTSLGNGGGLYIDGSERVTVEGSTFVDNHTVRGSGVFTATGSVTQVVNCVFEQNSATRAGAGMFNQVNATTVIGCTFRDNDAYDAEGGGGIWNENGEPVIQSCVFENNLGFQGAGVYSIDASPVIIDCLFIDNVAQTGAGVWNNRGEPYVADCTFVGNVASTGGGLYNEGGPSITLNCFFIRNQANDGDGGGGIVNSFDSVPSVIGCTFIENTADNELFGGGGGVANYIATSLILDCTFVRNHAELGGGAMYNELDAGLGPVYISHCRFLGNTASDGAAIHNFRSNSTITNSTFVGNTINTAGFQRGGAIFNHFIASPHIANCSIVMNEAPFGPGIANSDDSHPTIVNTIVWDGASAGGAAIIDGDAAVVNYSLVRGGHAGDANLDVNPALAGVPGPGADHTWGTADDDYGDLSLAPGSPARDAGHNWAAGFDDLDRDDDGLTDELLPSDVAGAPRFSHGGGAAGCGAAGTAVIDLGAYEAIGAADAVVFADIDGDGTVGFGDLLELIAAWGSCIDPCCLADLEDNGSVDFSDLLVLLGRWD